MKNGTHKVLHLATPLTKKGITVTTTKKHYAITLNQH